MSPCVLCKVGSDQVPNHGDSHDKIHFQASLVSLRFRSTKTNTAHSKMAHRHPLNTFGPNSAAAKQSRSVMKLLVDCGEAIEQDI